MYNKFIDDILDTVNILFYFCSLQVKNDETMMMMMLIIGDADINNNTHQLLHRSCALDPESSTLVFFY